MWISTHLSIISNEFLKIFYRKYFIFFFNLYFFYGFAMSSPKADMDIEPTVQNVSYVCGSILISFFSANDSFFFQWNDQTLFLTFIVAYYLLECGATNELKPQDKILCRACGGRILYKKRTAKGFLFFIVVNSYY